MQVYFRLCLQMPFYFIYLHGHILAYMFSKMDLILVDLLKNNEMNYTITNGKVKLETKIKQIKTNY